MKLTGAAISVSRGMKELQATPAADPFRSARERRATIMTPICPTCGVALTEGFVLDQVHGITKDAAVWVEGKPELSFFGNVKLGGHLKFTIQAFRCSECGLVHLYANNRAYR